ncbi:response regulator [Streptomyces sp. 4N509B]|uniref:response regulator n=1 Tax=Streptomyces sp. 4N509B TaxID=3457413 RepID=UPI003FD4486B
MPARILIAEDDRKNADLVRRFLEREGHATAIVHDGRAAIDEARRCRPDLLVLDLMLPRVDGLDVCRVLRSGLPGGPDIPIIMLTARASEDDLLLGLALGADDYVTKPYSPRELVARVRTVLRRASRAGAAPPERYQVGGLVIDTARHEVRLDGALVETTPAEFSVLACLAAAPGRAFTRQLLLEHVSGFGREVTGRTIDVHIMNLRRKIEREPTRPRHLLTVYGVGYKLADPEQQEQREQREQRENGERRENVEPAAP